MLLFLLGAAAGGTLGWFFWWSCRREAVQLDEEKQRLAQEKRIVLDFMHEMVEAIGEGVEREDLFEKVVHTAILSTGALSACVFEREGTKLRGVAIKGLFPPHRPLPPGLTGKAGTRAKFLEQILRSEVFEVGEGLVGAAAQSGKGILIENALSDPRVIKHDDPVLQVRSVIVTPISFRERNIGVLAVVNPSDGGAFGESDFSVAQSLAEQAGMAIHNLDLMAMQIEKNRLDVDLSLAREIQSMLLPKVFPRASHLDIATVYHPAQKVGGDFYDIFDLGEHRTGVAIADVSGKGVPASLVMAITQSNLRHFARSHDSPAEVLRRLNEVLDREMREDMFVTLVYAVVDLRSGEIVFARAGHEAPLLLCKHHGNGMLRAEPLAAEGMALGIVPDEIFGPSISDRRVPFEPGDVFLLYTDGVTEATNEEGTEFSSARLADTLHTLAGRSASELNTCILDRVRAFSQNRAPFDDITIVTLKRL